MWDSEKADEWEKEKLNNEWISAPSSQQFNVVRRVYQQDTLNRDADYQTPRRKLGHLCKKFVRKCGFSDCLRHSLPIVHWIRRYNVKEYLVNDMIAGATTAVLHIPQGMAYSLLAYAPPVMGLYMAFFPIFIYVILGNSPHVSIGTFAVAMLMAGKVVLEHATVPDESVGEYTPLEVLSALSFMVGLIQLLMWCLRLGAVSTLLSEPLVSGLTTGASFHVCASQLKDLFGIKLPKPPNFFKIIYIIIGVIKRLPDTNWAAFTISFITCFLLALNNEHIKPWLSKRSRFPIPAELIVIVAGTLTSSYMALNTEYGVTLVGQIPTGLPVPTLPPFDLLREIIVDAITLTMVTYTITLSMGLVFATKDKYEIDANQELLAMGAGNIFGSFFHCAPICASLSRSYVQYTVGCKSLITSLISALLILCVLLWIGPFFEALPRCVLAALVVVSLKGLFFQVTDLKKFWKLCKLDATVWICTFFVTVLVTVDIGLAAGLLASIGTLFFRSQTPYVCMLGRVLDTDIYLDIKRYRAAQEIPGIKIYHFSGGLNFASRNLFRAKLFRKIGYLRPTEPTVKATDAYPFTDPTHYVWDPTIGQRVRCVIIDASALSYIDAPGIKTLVGIKQDLNASAITMVLSGPNAPVLEMIERYNSLEKDRLSMLTFPTVHDALMFYQASVKKKQPEPESITTS